MGPTLRVRYQRRALPCGEAWSANSTFLMRCQVIFTRPLSQGQADISYEEQRSLAAELRDFGISIDDVCIVPGADRAGASDSPWVDRTRAELAFELRPPLDVEALLNYIASTGRAITFVGRPDWEATHESAEPITHVAYITSSGW